MHFNWLRSSRTSDVGSTYRLDEDGDAIPYPLEEYLGGDPAGCDLFGRVVSIERSDSQWILVVPRSKSSARDDFTIEWSYDLLSWHSHGVSFAPPTERSTDFLEQVRFEAAESKPLFVRFVKNKE